VATATCPSEADATATLAGTAIATGAPGLISATSMSSVRNPSVFSRIFVGNGTPSTVR